MLLRDNLLKRFLVLLKTTNIAQGGIFQWDSTQKRVLPKPKDRLKYFQIFCYFGWPFVILSTLQVLFSGQIPRALVFQSILFIFAFIASSHIQLTLFHWRSEIAAHFNALLEFEERYSRSYKTKREWRSYLTEACIFLGIISSPSLSLAYGGMISLQPCIPCNLGYFIMPECNHHVFSLIPGSLSPLLIKLPVLVINFIMVRFLFSGFILDVAGLALVQCHCIRSMLNLSKKLVIDPRGHHKTVINLFRQIQILEIIFNNFHKESVVFKLATMAITLPISIFALIKAKLNLAQNMFFVLAVVDSPVVIVVNFGIIGEVHKASTKLLKCVQADVTIQRNKLLKRCVRSWPILRARLGSANFIDKLTPAKTLDVSLSATTSLLLMS